MWKSGGRPDLPHVVPRPRGGEGETKSHPRSPKTFELGTRAVPKHSISPTSLKSKKSKNTFPKAPNDKGGRAAVVPLGEVNKFLIVFQFGRF